MKRKKEKFIDENLIVYGVGFLGSFLAAFILFHTFLLIQDNYGGKISPHWICFVGVVPILFLTLFYLFNVTKYFFNKK